MVPHRESQRRRNLNYYDSPENWLIWTAGPQVATYGATSSIQASTQLVPECKQELRFKCSDRPRLPRRPGPKLGGRTGLPFAGGRCCRAIHGEHAGPCSCAIAMNFTPVGLSGYSRGDDGSAHRQQRALASKFTRAGDNTTSSLFFVKTALSDLGRSGRGHGPSSTLSKIVPGSALRHRAPR